MMMIIIQSSLWLWNQKEKIGFQINYFHLRLCLMVMVLFFFSDKNFFHSEILSFFLHSIPEKREIQQKKKPRSKSFSSVFPLILCLSTTTTMVMHKHQLSTPVSDYTQLTVGFFRLFFRIFRSRVSPPSPTNSTKKKQGSASKKKMSEWHFFPSIHLIFFLYVA